MTNRYKVRMYESGDGDGSLTPGTIVLPVDRCFNVNAQTCEEAELQIRKDALNKKLPTGRVYQVSPMIGNPEAIRSIALDENANSSRVFLDAAKGLYSEFRRIRSHQLPNPVALPEREMVEA